LAVYDGYIFDYGGVLVAHQTDEAQLHMARVAGIPSDLFTEAYWSDREDYDKGLVTAADYWQAIAHKAGYTLTESAIEELVEIDNTSWMQFDEVMWDWINQLRAAGRRVAMLSNMPRDLGEAIKLKTERLNSFDQVTLSYEVRSVKPEAAIYEHCLDGLGTAPEKTIFLDDRIANVRGAELLGICAVQFTSRDEVLLKLRK
jgi:putative hydrolase of the HAD superfamily